MSAVPQVSTAEELKAQPEEFQTAIRKIVISHAINELQGARLTRTLLAAHKRKGTLRCFLWNEKAACSSPRFRAHPLTR